MSDRVYVFSMTYNQAGYTSVHNTLAGAETRLLEKVDEWCLQVEYENNLPEFEYGISHLEIEP